MFFRLTEVPELLLSYSSSDSLCKMVSLQNKGQMVHVMINAYIHIPFDDMACKCLISNNFLDCNKETNVCVC